MGDQQGKFSTAASRWAGVGPYYAMFPTEFADRVIAKYTSHGDTIIDPFAGRGTAVFSAAASGRCGVGVELNPVGWVYAQAKINPATKTDVLSRLAEVAKLCAMDQCLPDLPEFFTWCFTPDVRRFLVAARRHLNWRQSKVDWTLTAILMVNLHGKREASLSNQMRQTKAMSPDYAINWWRERGMRPPKVDPVEFLTQRINWRYTHGTVEAGDSFVYLGDSTERLAAVKKRVKALSLPNAQLLLTSPPYCGVTNYHYDQWLRRWVLGGPPEAVAAGGRHRGKFYDQEKYKRLLYDVFTEAKPVLRRDAVVYVRTDYREVTLRATVEVLREVFPRKRMFRYARQIDKKTQTHLFANKVEKSAEVDVVLLPAA
ncbi:MAG TPA: DNA methyltransferase [Tepidisphaeraceae bacterium]|jgi:hypothetical protein